MQPPPTMTMSAVCFIASDSHLRSCHTLLCGGRNDKTVSCVVQAQIRDFTPLPRVAGRLHTVDGDARPLECVMTRFLDRRFLIVLVLGVFAAGCGKDSSPTSPTSSSAAGSTGVT